MASIECGCRETLDTAGRSKKPFGPIKGEYDDIQLDVFTYFPAAYCLLSAGNDSNCENCKSFYSEKTSSAGSIMALSGDLKCLCLGESLNIYATIRFILENELYSFQGKAKSVETAVHGKLEETSNPRLDRRPDHPGEFCQ